MCPCKILFFFFFILFHFYSILLHFCSEKGEKFKVNQKKTRLNKQEKFYQNNLDAPGTNKETVALHSYCPTATNDEEKFSADVRRKN